MDSYVSAKEPRGGLMENYVTTTELEILKEDHIKTVVEVATRRVVTRIVGETIQDILTVHHDKQK